MSHSGILSILVFIVGFTTGLFCLLEPQLYIKSAGLFLIFYLLFILVQQFEENKE